MSEIYTAINSIMAKVGHIGKDRNNQQQGFKYRGIDDAYNALNPLLAEFGVFTVPEVMEKTREERTNSKGTTLAFTCLRMKYTFYAKDGSSVSAIVEGEGMDSGDKSSNKAMAVAHKYALLQVFCIPTEDQKDQEAESHEVNPRDGAEFAGILEDLEESAAGGTAKLMSAFKAIPNSPAKIAAWKEHGARLKAMAAKQDEAA